MTITERLKQLSVAVAEQNWREFSMRVPAEPDRDADIVIMQAAMLIESRDAEIESLRQQLNACRQLKQAYIEELADMQKREVMLRDTMARVAERLDAQQQPFSAQVLREALAATDDLKDVRLCHAAPVETLKEAISLMNIDIDLYRAWEPKCSLKT